MSPWSLRLHSRHLRLLGAVGVIAMAGCILTSGQISIFFEFGSLNITSPTNLVSVQIRLEDNTDYTDHRDKLVGLVDCALLGEVTNHGSTTLEVEFWMTTEPSTHTTASALAGDGTAVRIWGPFVVQATETRRIDWDTSAGLFNDEGKQELLNELKAASGADGRFTLYALGAGTTYNFSIADGVLILVLDAGL